MNLLQLVFRQRKQERKKIRNHAVSVNYTLQRKRKVATIIVMLARKHYGNHYSFSPLIVILSWFVDKPIVDRAIKQHQLIKEEDVECKPERVTEAVVDENVDIHLVRKYFTSDAWMLVEEVVKHKSTKMTWTCRTCFHDLHTEQSIICDSCLLWFHCRCVGLKRLPKCRNWFCRSCFAEAK